MKYLFKLVLVVMLPLASFAQESEIDRKGRFLFNLGPEYRITPIYNIPEVTNFTIASYTNIDKQNSGMALNFGTEYFVTKNLALGFTNSLRYDLVISEFTEIQNDFGIKKADYKLLMGYHIYLAYHFKLFKKGEFYANAGISLLNRNSDFSTKETFYNEDGSVLATNIIILDYHYSANKLVLGYKNGRGKLALGLYVTKSTSYFDETTRFIVPFVGYSFDFGKL